MGLNETPSANRLHIGVFGRTNSGKSSFINALTGQNVSIVSDVAGTTTDAVTKAMEIHPLGPCVLIDTAGFDDTTILGEARKEKTRLAAEKCDIAVIVFAMSTNCDISLEMEWYDYFIKVRFLFYFFGKLHMTLVHRVESSAVNTDTHYFLPFV